MTGPRVARLLIANRGEAALRVLRAGRAAGLFCGVAHSVDDAGSLPVRRADQALPLPGSGPRAYLDVDALLAAAAGMSATLLHPGWGFLSEDADFAQRCEAAEVTFVGPSPAVLAQVGDKAAARALALRCGLQVLPGTPGAASRSEVQALIEELGPGAQVLIKALAGGGGRGIRGADADTVDAAYHRAASEAAAATGRSEVYAEQRLARARHLEVQLAGDGAQVRAVGDRDCSVQRRFQKLVEIAPAPGLERAVRRRMHAEAVQLGEQVGLRGLATVEFLLDLDGTGLYFLEVNPRVQVEHTVTEQVHGLDLVALGLALAQGASLAALGEHPARGSAVQLRLLAERMGNHAEPQPATGVVTTWTPPGGPGVRVDSALEVGLEVTGRYDSLLAKIIVTAEDLPAALAGADRALTETELVGVATNADLLRAVLAVPELATGGVHTAWVEAQRSQLPDAPPVPAGWAPGGTAVSSPGVAVVVSVDVTPGDVVRRGQQLVVLEAMKMEQVVSAPVDATVAALAVAVGEPVLAGQALVHLVELDAPLGPAQDGTTDLDLDQVRPDLAELRRREGLLLDAARPAAVTKIHARGRRTARENIADLVDPGSWVEYGGFGVAAQRARRGLDALITETPGDGVVSGLATVNAELVGADRAAAAVLSYDYSVLAGTQGTVGHAKKDRLLDVVERLRVPAVLFAEGGGGRPGDTDYPVASGLQVPAFALWAGLAGVVPRIGIGSGRVFGGNAALLGCSDVVIATRDATIGMGGPAMIEGGGLGVFTPEEVGPAAMHAATGVVDVLVEDDAAAVATARCALAYFQGDVVPVDPADPRVLRSLVPENRLRAFDTHAVIDALADAGSVLELRAEHAPGMITALVRLGGRAVGVIANDSRHLAGAITSAGAASAVRLLELCQAFGLPVLSLVDTPGIMVGPEAERTGLVHHASRLFLAAARLSVPVVAVVLRKAYGLGAQAMMAGSTRAPVLTAAWPSAEFGGMGFEGAVRLALRKELAAIADPAERDAVFQAAVAEQYARGSALSTALHVEIDTVVDPADTRRTVLAALRRTPRAETTDR